MANQSYDETVTASGGTPPHVFTITSGALPAGFTLNPATGVISGVTTQTGLFNFTIRATAAGGCFGSRPYTLTVRAGTAAVPALDPPALALMVILLAAVGVFVAGRFTS